MVEAAVRKKTKKKKKRYPPPSKNGIIEKVELPKNHGGWAKEYINLAFDICALSSKCLKKSHTVL